LKIATVDPTISFVAYSKDEGADGTAGIEISAPEGNLSNPRWRALRPLQGNGLRGLHGLMVSDLHPLRDSVRHPNV